MCLLFAGSLWLIYSPSEKERAAEEKEKGFNTDIPSPGQQRMDGNKVDAYEREELEKRISTVKCISGDGLAVRQFR